MIFFCKNPNLKKKFFLKGGGGRGWVGGAGVREFYYESKLKKIWVGIGWLVACFGFNGPLRQYFSLYRAVSQIEGERGEKG